MAGAVVEVGKLLTVVLDALGASVAVAVLFSLAVLGIARASDEAERDARAVLGYGALAAVCLLACLAAGVYGVVLLSSK
ncbi:MAG TPA: hypothetical protein VGD00_05620 [Solirubrobacteraceae bacterium]|jgi:undecaprenyl pyrophosphate phosphatase UppP